MELGKEREIEREQKNVDKFCVYDWSIYEMIFVSQHTIDTSGKSAQLATFHNANNNKTNYQCHIGADGEIL